MSVLRTILRHNALTGEPLSPGNGGCAPAHKPVSEPEPVPPLTRLSGLTSGIAPWGAESGRYCSGTLRDAQKPGYLVSFSGRAAPSHQLRPCSGLPGHLPHRRCSRPKRDHWPCPRAPAGPARHRLTRTTATDTRMSQTPIHSRPGMGRLLGVPGFLAHRPPRPSAAASVAGVGLIMLAGQDDMRRMRRAADGQARDVSALRARMVSTVSSTVMAEVSSQSPIRGVSWRSTRSRVCGVQVP
jgi:hypothetical protein